jgi:hypothetical protein
MSLLLLFHPKSQSTPPVPQPDLGGAMTRRQVFDVDEDDEEVAMILMAFVSKGPG